MIAAATGRTPTLYRRRTVQRCGTPGRGKVGQAEIALWTLPFDWINDSNTRQQPGMLMTQIKPVVLFHGFFLSTVDVVYQFIPVLKPTALSPGDHRRAARAEGARRRTAAGKRSTANELRDIPAESRR